MNPINDMHDLIEENARLERVLLIQKQHIAELVKWEAVFGHLGTPDEVGNEWHKLLDRISKLERALYLMTKSYKSVPYAQWPAEMHFANEVLEKSK